MQGEFLNSAASETQITLLNVSVYINGMVYKICNYYSRMVRPVDEKVTAI